MINLGKLFIDTLLKWKIAIGTERINDTRTMMTLVKSVM